MTTASLPWMTGCYTLSYPNFIICVIKFFIHFVDDLGTSINPLLRAAYLTKDRPEGMVTLLIPWLESHEQEFTYPPGIRFEHPDNQKQYVKV